MPLTDQMMRAAFDGPWTATRDGKRVGSDDLRINQNSINLSLTAEILEITPGKHGYIDLHDADSFGIARRHCLGGLILEPGRLYLGAVREAFDCTAPLWVPSRYRTSVCMVPIEQQIETWFYPEIAGRSTSARVGLSVEICAGKGDWGFGANGATFTLELKAELPLKFYAGDHIAQIYFCALSGEPETPYQSVYASQTKVTPARLGPERFR